MPANYLIRLDDAHHRYDKDKWQRIEQMLFEYDVKPIVAVIPDNRDPQISAAPAADPAFWSTVRAWQDKGWAIAIHGLHHVLIPAKNPTLSFAKHSEFCGKSVNEQVDMLRAALKIFKTEQCSPAYFVAPAHGYDSNTIEAIKQTGANLVVSDGFCFRPVQQSGIRYIPQQLWRPRRMPFGLWTICLHPSSMGERDFDRMGRFIKEFRSAIVSADEIRSFPSKSIFDNVFERALLCVIRTKLKMAALLF